MSRKRLRRTGQPMTSGSRRALVGPGEDVSVQELIDTGAKLSGVAAGLLEELTLADLRHLGVRVRQAPAPKGAR